MRNRRKTPRDTDRLKALRDRLDRLVEEGREIRAQVDGLADRDQLDELRRMLKKQSARAGRNPLRGFW